MPGKTYLGREPNTNGDPLILPKSLKKKHLPMAGAVETIQSPFNAIAGRLLLDLEFRIDGVIIGAS
jgi:hypothetical protein